MLKIEVTVIDDAPAGRIVTVNGVERTRVFEWELAETLHQIVDEET